MTEIFIDVLQGSNNTITVTENDNLTETYKLILMKNRIRINLTNKKVKFVFLKENSNNGDIFDEMNISNPTEGEIDFPITNQISKENGMYSCGLAIYNNEGYLEHTGTFNLYVKENLFEKVSGELLENSAYKELMSLLDKATNLNNELNPLVTNGTALKNDLENDINQADNLKNDLENNTNRASGVNSELVKNTVTAVEKNTTLNNSLNEAKKYIENLDGSQNLPQIRDDITTLQNGLKSNQELAYEGQYLTCENTLDGRIEDIVLEGRTLQNLFDYSKLKSEYKYSDGIITNKVGEDYAIWTDVNSVCNLIKSNAIYTIVIKELTENTIVQFSFKQSDPNTIDFSYVGEQKILKVTSISDSTGFYFKAYCSADVKKEVKVQCMLLEGDWTNKEIPHYFEGIKSVGEKEENKIKLYSCNKNLFDTSKMRLVGGYYTTDYLYDDINNPIRIKLKARTTYKFKAIKNPNLDSWVGLCIFINGIKKYLGNNGNGDFNFSFTTPDTGEIYFSLGKNNQSDTVSLKNIQLEENTFTNYEEHQEDKKEILLEDGLKGLQNGICDTIENREDGIYLIQRVDKIVLDGSSDEGWAWGRTDGDGNTKRFSLPINNSVSTWSTTTGLICDRFAIIGNNWSFDIEGIAIDGGKNLGIRINTSKLTTQDVTGFKKWLQENPVTVYYELAKPIETKISDTKLSLDTYNALTYVFSNNAISPNIKLKVASNLGSIIQQNARSINDIYKLIDEVLIPQITTNTANIELLKLK